MLAAGGRRGGAAGCLLALLALAAAAYVGASLGQPYIRMWRFREAMEAQVRAAETYTDDEIRRSLAETAADLGIPLGAREIQVRRGRGAIEIRAAWEEEVVLRKYRRTLHFQPFVSASVTSQPP